MRSKKTKLAILAGLTVIASAWHSAPPPPSPPTGSLVDPVHQPPYVWKMWVQKLTTPVNGNNMIIRLQYDTIPVMPLYLTVEYNDGEAVTFNDDGVEPDITPGDRIYGAYVYENLSAFAAEAEEYEDSLAAAGSFLRFEGHAGEKVTALPSFDSDGFDAGDEVEFSMDLLEAPLCGNHLLKQNSLFITDLSVVEDPARTYNVTANTGNWQGAWTFGTLMKAMAHQSSTGVSATEFLRSWVATWMNSQTVNEQVIAPREDALVAMIAPWIRKASHPDLPSYTSIHSGNWEQYWTGLHQDSILKYAPFKLMAIVNRIDLRGSTAYGSTPFNAGETRFIFTLIDPPSGLVPTNFDQEFTFPNGNFLDWRGMNVIIEYRNTAQNICELKNWAQRWYDLSAFPSFGSDFNDSLEAITHVVTDANAMPAYPNGSALAQLRTNERLFFQPDGEWEKSHWQFRQFEIKTSTHKLAMTTLTNNPKLESTSPTNLFSYDFDHNNPDFDDARDSFMAWVWPMRYSLSQGQHVMPAKYLGTNNPLLAGAAEMVGQQFHHVDANWSTTSAAGYSPSYLNIPLLGGLYRKARRQLSLNTCVGCHSGETKTIFNQVRPRGYGKPAHYWDIAIPSHDTGFLDLRFAYNAGFSNDTVAMKTVVGTGKVYNTSVGDSNANMPNMPYRVYPVVSPFLTGRNYAGSYLAPHYNDDEPGPGDNPLDNKFDDRALFYVNDPANDGVPGTMMQSGYLGSPIGPQRRIGFNDLARRKKDLCQFLNSTCNSGPVGIRIATAVAFQPFPLASH